MSEQVEIKTVDGVCRASVFKPSSGAGPWPAAIVFMDAFGYRPAQFQMSQRTADEGFVVLLPDLFYRAGAYAPLVPKEIFAANNARELIGPLRATTSNQIAAKDAASFIAYLDTRSDVKKPKIGVIGYCMGGGMALTAAATYPDRIAAAVSLHGGALADDTEQSPHLLAPRLKAFTYIGAAVEDNSYPPDMAVRLQKTLDEAGVRYKHEVYEGQRHGWTKPDFPIFNAEASERSQKTAGAIFRQYLN